MSFNRSSALESQPTTFRRDDDPQYADDPEFNKFTEELSEKLFSYSSNINKLARQVELLGTKRETERVRERVQNLIEETGDGFKEVGEGLKRINAWSDLGPHQVYTQRKLTNEFNTSLSEFQVLSRRAIEKQREARAAIIEAESAAGDGSSGAQGQGQDQVQLQEQPRLADQSEVDFQSSLIVERETEIRQIEQSVGELNELFRDVASMVHDQGAMIDTIEGNVVNVRDDTRGADTELTQANRYQRNARSKAFCLLLILAIVVLVIILAVVIG
ncbi:hypothetical protein FH972_026000 [Carpinus fangiana]|uniref:t-SNARE coiled-coil homology domain-containing protein n=1 Tax=Carpinus fangiana TaxID=176857 RepID=A0A5N6L2N3_9ROSI|nr:hypothetical protein FH972_026000 [Carpinus fangiana]